MTNPQRERYARHLLLPGFGEQAQEKLLNSKVLLIGAGGLGSPAALYLVAAGVGYLTITDPDVVDLSNLQRQILHREEDVGKPKVESAARELGALNSDCQIEYIQEPFNISNAMQLVEGHDLVIDGSDNFATRFLVNDACYFAKTPLVYGSIFQFEGQLTFFDYSEESPCYRCIVPEPPEEGAVPNCIEAGVIGTLPGIIGSLQAMEAIKYLSGLGAPPIGKLLYYDALQISFREIALQKDLCCPLCSENPTIRELSEIKSAVCELEEVESITAKELAEILPGNPFLIDVREPKEFAQKRIPGSQLVPLSQLKEGRIPDLPKNKTIYVHCKSGARSLRAIQVLKEAGYSMFINVFDGIDGW